MMLISFFITIIVALILIPILRKVKVGQIERDDGPKSHLKKQGTPTMGGIIFMISIILCVIGAYIYCNINLKFQLINNILPLLALTIGFGLVGAIDDFKKLVLKNTVGLKPRYKMLGLLVISVVFALFMIKINSGENQILIPFVKQYIRLPIYIYIPFAIVVFLATTNAVNLTDGIDGLSSSVCTIIITCLTVLSVLNRVLEVSLFGSIVIGATLGFLIFNLYPAKIFMGDTGSLFLGGVIAGIALYLEMPLLLIIIAIVPILETLSVIIQVMYYKKTGNRIFKMAPIHHHFELSGWNENKVVRIFSIITLLVSIIGVYSVI